MKRNITALAIAVGFSASMYAVQSLAAPVPVAAKGDTLKCAPTPPNPANMTIDGAVVTCRIAGGESRGGGLVGNVEGGRIVWHYWNLSELYFVHVAGQGRPVLESSLRTDAAGNLDVTVLQDVYLK